jgi:hypothetical protein
MDTELKDHHTTVVYMIATYWPNRTTYHYIEQKLTDANFSIKHLTPYQELVNTFFK